MPDSIFLGKKILVCVCGSVAAYKSAEIVSSLKKEGASVTVVLTESAKKFVAPLTFEVLSENQVYDGIFDQKDDKIPHVNLAKKADLMLVAPATADYVARVANGYASDLASALALSTKCPVVIAPAMNTQMLESEPYRENVARLKAQGKLFIDAEEGALACGDIGRGRLAEVDGIVKYCEKILRLRNSLKNMKFLVTYGPTIEKIDDMRYISNFSSGLMGYQIVKELTLRGADVIVVAGPNRYDRPNVSKYINVESANEMSQAVKKYYDAIDCLIMAAAVADFSVEAIHGKIKRSKTTSLRLIPTEDILKSITQSKRDKVVVGFCAESENLIVSARRKLIDKNLDLVVANPLGNKEIGPDARDNEVHLVSRDVTPVSIPKASKRIVAEKIIDYLADHIIPRVNR